MEDTIMAPKSNEAAVSLRSSSPLSSGSFKKLSRTVSTGSVASSSKSSISGSSSNSANSKRKSTSLPPETVDYLKDWIMSPEHIAHPYPTEQEKANIMRDTGIELKQLTNWFVNNRKRFWKPRVEARLLEQKSGTVSPALKSNDDKIVEEDTNTKLNNNTLSVTFSLGQVVASLAATAEEEATTRATMPSSPPRPPSVSPETSPSRRLMSGQLSVVSEMSCSGSESSNDEETSCCAGQTTREEPYSNNSDAPTRSRTETIQIHILRPSCVSQQQEQPTIEDVTVLPNIPAERTLYSYNDCLLTYRVLPSDDTKKIQRRRDAEIVRLKKSFLKLFLSQQPLSQPVVVPANMNKRRRTVSIDDSTLEGDHICSPRRKFRRASIELWKKACQTAGSVYDQELPSLEEATALFGFASSTEQSAP